jgi:O-antigen/teichoic acid export membrane protein
LSILGPTLVDAADVLRVMAVLAVVKAVSMTLGPTLLILHAQRVILGMIATALVTKLIVMAWVVPHYGAIGVACAAVAIDSLLLVVPVLVITARMAGLRLHPGVALKVIGLCALSVYAARWTFTGHVVLPLLAAPTLFLALAWASGTLRWGDWRSLRPAVPASEASR